MTTSRPVHTIKYMQSSFKKYLAMAIICAVVTVFASLLAALSGIQVAALRKSNTAAIETDRANQTQQIEASAKVQEDLNKKLAVAQQQLATEKQNVKNLIGKVAELERQLSISEAKLHALEQQTAAPRPHSAANPAPPQPIVPEKPVQPESEAAPGEIKMETTTEPEEEVPPPQQDGQGDSQPLENQNGQDTPADSE